MAGTAGVEVRLPMPPRPKGMVGGYEGCGSWRVVGAVVVVVEVGMEAVGKMCVVFGLVLDRWMSLMFAQSIGY